MSDEPTSKVLVSALVPSISIGGVGFSDFLALAGNFGNGNLVAVPEPSALLLLAVVGVLGWAAWRVRPPG